MSGGFDLMVLIEGKTMKEVALFVAEAGSVGFGFGHVHPFCAEEVQG